MHIATVVCAPPCVGQAELSALPFPICCSVPGLCCFPSQQQLGFLRRLGAGWDVLRAGHMSGLCSLLDSFMSNVAVHKGHIYCVAELYIIQCLFRDILIIWWWPQQQGCSLCWGQCFMLAHTAKWQCSRCVPFQAWVFYLWHAGIDQLLGFCSDGMDPYLWVQM